MGVLQCYRRGCQNIMCDRYSSTYGYICNECFDELMILGVDTNVEDFMNTHKQTVRKQINDTYNLYNTLFPLRLEE